MSKIATLPNILSLSRAPLALLFLLNNPMVRSITLVVAMLTDGLDGFLARKSKTTSLLGVVLDPAMDKFFVILCLGVFLSEGKLELWQVLMMLSRDFSLCLFGVYLYLARILKNYAFRSILWGKITTFLQFIILIQVNLDLPVFPYFFPLFIFFAFLALIELYQSKNLVI